MIMEDLSHGDSNDTNYQIPLSFESAATKTIESLVQADDSNCCNVYVANLPPLADANTLRELFSPIGKVLHVKLLLDIASGVSRGIAFVMFENENVARKACVLKNKVNIGGNVLQVRLAERSSQHASVHSHVRSNIVYIRNVPGNILRHQVKQLCESRFGPVLDVTPHPQSAELKGPSPFNMDFVVFRSVDDASRCVEGVDGKGTFPIPSGHPFTMAKMITDVAGEMRKSILLRRRTSEGLSGTKPQEPSRVAREEFFSQPVQINPNFQPFALSAPMPQPPVVYSAAPPVGPNMLPMPMVLNNWPAFDTPVSIPQRLSMNASPVHEELPVVPSHRSSIAVPSNMHSQRNSQVILNCAPPSVHIQSVPHSPAMPHPVMVLPLHHHHHQPLTPDQMHFFQQQNYYLQQRH